MTDRVASDTGDIGDVQRKEIYTYEAPWTVYAMAWSYRTDPNAQFRIAIGSFVEKYSNKVRIVRKRDTTTANQNEIEYDNQIYEIGQFDHPYPCTKIMWSPDARNSSARDLLATSGDYLRLWNVSDSSSTDGQLTIQREVMLQNSSSEYCAPLTSFDWNEVDPNIIGTASFDTTCTIWDVTTQQARTQLIAHDKEVFDISFSSSAGAKDIFASVGADASVRMFDLRSLNHSTIIYECHDRLPLLRLEWNKQDPRYLATFTESSNQTTILDIRSPNIPLCVLGGHNGVVNATAWAPHSYSHIVTAGDDSQALIWELSSMQARPIDDPILAYNADAEINNLQWSTTQPDWISIAYENKLQILRV